MASNRSVFTAIWLVSAAVYAQSGPAGKWTGEEQSRGGTVPIVLQLSVNNSAVTGTITVGETPTQAISEGKIDGNILTFKTATMLNGKEVPVLWEGEVQDNQLPLVRTIGTGGRKRPPIAMRRSK